MEGGRQAELRQGCRQRPGREGGSAQAGMQRMPGEGCGQCPGGKEAAPGEGGRECPERAAGIRQKHRLLPGLWGGADGKRPSHVPPAVCWVQRRHPFPPRRPAASVLSCPPRTSPPGQTPSGEAGRTPPGEPFPPPPPLLAVLLGTSLHLLLRQPPARGQGWGFLCARGGTPSPGWLQAPPKEGHFCCSVCIFGSPGTEHLPACWTEGRCWLHLREHGPGPRDTLLMDSLHPKPRSGSL